MRLPPDLFFSVPVAFEKLPWRSVILTDVDKQRITSLAQEGNPVTLLPAVGMFRSSDKDPVPTQCAFRVKYLVSDIGNLVAAFCWDVVPLN